MAISRWLRRFCGERKRNCDAAAGWEQHAASASSGDSGGTQFRPRGTEGQSRTRSVHVVLRSARQAGDGKRLHRGADPWWLEPAQVLTDIREGMRILDTGTNLSDVESAEQKLRPARELISSAFGSASTPTVATPKPASQQPVPGANWARGWLEARG